MFMFEESIKLKIKFFLFKQRLISLCFFVYLQQKPNPIYRCLPTEPIIPGW